MSIVNINMSDTVSLYMLSKLESWEICITIMHKYKQMEFMLIMASVEEMTLNSIIAICSEKSNSEIGRIIKVWGYGESDISVYKSHIAESVTAENFLIFDLVSGIRNMYFKVYKIIASSNT